MRPRRPAGVVARPLNFTVRQHELSAVPAYAKFSIGSAVRVAPRDRLERFRSTWKFHHPLQEVQLQYAGTASIVSTVSYYHGGDALYTLDGSQGIWHEECIVEAIAAHAV